MKFPELEFDNGDGEPLPVSILDRDEAKIFLRPHQTIEFGGERFQFSADVKKIGGGWVATRVYLKSERELEAERFAASVLKTLEAENPSVFEEAGALRQEQLRQESAKRQEWMSKYPKQATWSDGHGYHNNGGQILHLGDGRSATPSAPENPMFPEEGWWD